MNLSSSKQSLRLSLRLCSAILCEDLRFSGARTGDCSALPAPALVAKGLLGGAILPSRPPVKSIASSCEASARTALSAACAAARLPVLRSFAAGCDASPPAAAAAASAFLRPAPRPLAALLASFAAIAAAAASLILWATMAGEGGSMNFCC